MAGLGLVLNIDRDGYQAVLGLNRATHATTDADARRWLAFYAENGPTGLCRYKLPQRSTAFGIEGYLVMLVGNGVPYRARHQPSVQEVGTWKRHIAGNVADARAAMDVREALNFIRHPKWQWIAGPQPQTAMSSGLNSPSHAGKTRHSTRDQTRTRE